MHLSLTPFPKSFLGPKLNKVFLLSNTQNEYTMKDISSQESNLNLAQCLVVDLGTATTKSGWSNKSEPDFSIPSIVGHGRHKGAMLTLGLKDSYVGRQAQALQGILEIQQPFKQGCVQHWDDLELLWDHVWTQELKRIRVSLLHNNLYLIYMVTIIDSFRLLMICILQLTTDSDTSDIKVLVSVPPLCPPEDWRKLAETFFEDKGIGGLYLANKSVLAMYGGGRTTGICVDTGEDMTYIVPCWEGTPLPNATIIQKLGGKHVTDRLLGLLSNGKYSFPDDTFLLLRGRGGRGFSVVSRRDVVKEAKERFCRVDPVNGLKSATKMEEQVLKLPDGNIVVVGDEATSAPGKRFIWVLYFQCMYLKLFPSIIQRPTFALPFSWFLLPLHFYSFYVDLLQNFMQKAFSRVKD